MLYYTHTHTFPTLADICMWRCGKDSHIQGDAKVLFAVAFDLPILQIDCPVCHIGNLIELEMFLCHWQLPLHHWRACGLMPRFPIKLLTFSRTCKFQQLGRPMV